MSAFTCDVGDVPTISFFVTNAAGESVDPSEVLLYLQTPAGSVGTYTLSAGQVTRQALGTFSYNGTATQAGYWNVRWVGTGAANAAEQSRYFVRGSNIT